MRDENDKGADRKVGERKDLEGPTIGHILSGSRTLKVTGGKLLHVDVDIGDGAIVNVMITGDFFIYPEETLAAIERSLIGVEGRGTKERP